MFCFAFINAQSPPAPSYNTIGLKVFFDASVINESLRKEVKTMILDEGIGFVTQNKEDSHINISFDEQNYNISSSKNGIIIFKIDDSKPEKTAQLLKEKIRQYAYGFYIRNLNFKNPSYKFSFRLKPMKYNDVSDNLEEVSLENHPESNGVLNFNTSNSAVILEVTNLSESPIYFSVIEINSRAELQGFIPNANCPLIGSERKIPPKKTVAFETCFFQFGPPFETLTLKGFATSEPINFNPIINNEDNNSLDYVQSYYTEMYTYDFEYNIVDSKGNMPYDAPVDFYRPNSSPELNTLLADLKTVEATSGKLSQNYINTLNKISKLHSDLGNLEESKTFAKKYARLSRQKKEKKQSMSKRYSEDDQRRRRAAIRATRLSRMNDAEKVEFLTKEHKQQQTEISILNDQIKRLKKELETLRSSTGANAQMRGVIPKSKKKDIASEYTYRALIIAEQDYKDENIDNLKFPIKDAEALKNVLINNYAFDTENIVFLKNPTRKDIFKALENLFQVSSEKDHLLIFYAGHGVYDANFKRGYWLPSDAEIGSKSSWMSNLDIKDYISNIKTKHTLLISDACFSGSIFEYNRDINTNATTKAFEKLLKKNARNAMTSGLDKPVPDESVFIKYLLKTLIY